MSNTFNLKKFLVENKLTTNSRQLGENEYSSEGENEIHQIMSVVKEKIGFDYPLFKDIVENAIELMEEEDYLAPEALYAATQTWNEEFRDNGDENGEDITSRMMSILDSMQA